MSFKNLSFFYFISELHSGPSLTHHNRTLMIKDVSRSAEGRYQCAVYNALGRGDSKEIGVYVLSKYNFYSSKNFVSK